MKLYEIDNAIAECLDFETGEILDLDRLSELQIEREKKLENVALFIKQLEAEAEAIKNEEICLAERRKAKENRAAGLKGWLSAVLDGQAFETSRVRLSFRKNEKVEFEDELSVLEYLERNNLDNCLKYKFPDILKPEVKKLLKAGEKIPGAVLVETNNLQMK